MGVDSKPEALNKLVSQAIKYLSYRNRSTQELKDYLLKKSGGDKELTDTAINKIKKFNLLNDAEFTRLFIEARLRQGKGPLLITLELKRRGVDPLIINAELQKIESVQWLESAQNLIKHKHLQKTNLSNPGTKAKIYRYLSGRGFQSKTIYSVIDVVGNQ